MSHSLLYPLKYFLFLTIKPSFYIRLLSLTLQQCYDLRFPELSLCLRAQGADILTYPSAFTFATGASHWEPLLRARAIESQCYVVAAAQSGMHNEKRSSWGHAMVISKPNFFKWLLWNAYYFIANNTALKFIRLSPGILRVIYLCYQFSKLYYLYSGGRPMGSNHSTVL